MCLFSRMSVCLSGEKVFDGEEFSMHARLWTRGYDTYTPDKSLVGHDYNKVKDGPQPSRWGLGLWNRGERGGRGCSPLQFVRKLEGRRLRGRRYHGSGRCMVVHLSNRTVFRTRARKERCTPEHIEYPETTCIIFIFFGTLQQYPLDAKPTPYPARPPMHPLNPSHPCPPPPPPLPLRTAAG